MTGLKDLVSEKKNGPETARAESEWAAYKKA
jgi:hypothetical protein